MRTRIFPATGQTFSEIGLGTWQLGGTEWGDIPDSLALDTLAAAAEAGVTFFDTADIYGLGRSESLIGQFLKGRTDRDRFIVATKLGRWPQPGFPGNFEPSTIIAHTEASLLRLGVDCIDLTQTHCIPHEVMKHGDVFQTLSNLVKAGKIALLVQVSNRWTKQLTVWRAPNSRASKSSLICCVKNRSMCSSKSTVSRCGDHCAVAVGQRGSLGKIFARNHISRV